MPSTYSSNLKLELMATGENSGTWGNITNTNLGTAAEQAIVGYGSVVYASDANLTISITNSNAAQAARALVLNVTSSVSLTGTRELVVPTIEKQYIVQNNTTGSQSITVKTSAGTGITVPNGRKAHLYVDGTNVIQMFDFVDINGGTIDGTAIGGSSAAAGSFTTLGASGAATFNGAVTLGDAAADLIVFNGTVNSHLLFTDNTYDIGASGATRPRNLFLAGAATIGGNLSVGGTLTLTGGLILNGNVTVGDSSADTLTVNATITSNLLFTDNTYDIGASGATRPRNLFLAGNATIGGNTTMTGSLTVDSTTDSSSTTTGSIQTDGGLGVAKALYVGTTASVGGVPTLQGELNVFKSGSAPTLYVQGDTSNTTTQGIIRLGGSAGRSASIQGYRESSSNLHALRFYSYNSADQLNYEITAGGTSIWYVGGSEGMRLTSTGLGVGTSSPSVKLQSAVSRTSGNNTVALVLSDNVTGGQTSGFGTQIQGWSNNGAAVSAIGFEAFGGTNNDTGIGFYTQSSAGNLNRRMTITSVGAVGIGTAAPSTFGRLAITATASGSKAGIGIDNNGFNGTTASPTEIGMIELFTANGTFGAGMYSLNSYTTNSANWLSFKTTDTVGTTAERVRIDATGNLLVGKTSTTLNNTSGVAIAPTSIAIGSSSGNGTLEVGANRSAVAADIGGVLSFRAVYRNSDSDTTTIANIKGFRSNATNNNWDSYLAFETTSSGSVAEKLRITSVGDVGIGTASPAAKLEVNGLVVPLRLDGMNALPSNQTACYVGPISDTGGGGINGDLVLVPRTSAGGSILFATGSTTPSIRMRINASGNVGIGISPSTILHASRDSGLATGTGTTVALRLEDTGQDGGAGTWNTTQQFTAVQFYSGDQSGVGASVRASIGATMQDGSGSASALTFFTNSGTNTERARITSTGSFLIGTTTANGANLAVGAVPNDVIGTQAAFFSGAKAKYAGIAQLPQGQLFLYDTNSAAGSGGAISFGGNAGGGQQTWYAAIEALKNNGTAGDYGGAMAFYTRPSGSTAGERMRITSGGSLLVGTTTSYDSVFTTSATGSYSSGNVNAIFVNPSGRGTVRIRSEASEACELFFDTGGGVAWDISCRSVSEGKQMLWFPSAATPSFGNVGTQVMTLTQAGNLTITGALAKGSGSFQIDHPLPSLNETHHLVHSFVEAPQADLYYRGKVTLVNGRATVNIDQVAGMTEGTFVLLNREVQCFTSNESDWDAVRGSVAGNILTIECQNPASTATISWMVVGERQDKHMYDTDWTDENGKVIVEPVKPPPIEPPTFNR